MRAWWVERPGSVHGSPLRLGGRNDPAPGPGEVRLQISRCGICRTDLHLAEGDLAPRRRRARRHLACGGKHALTELAEDRVGGAPVLTVDQS